MHGYKLGKDNFHIILFMTITGALLMIFPLYETEPANYYGVKAVLDNNLYNISSEMPPAADISEEMCTTNYQAMPK